MDGPIIFNGAPETADGCFTKETVLKDTKKHIYELPREKAESGFPLPPEALTDCPISSSQACTRTRICTLSQALRQPAEQ